MYGKKKTKQNKTNHKQTNETWNNKLELYLLFLQLFFIFPFVLFSFTFNYTLFFFSFSLACASSYIPSFFRCSGSTDAISLSEQCESHIAFPGITFTYLFGAHTYPSHPFSSVFLSNVFSPLRIHFPLFDLLLFFSLTYFCFSHIVPFRNRYT